MQVGLLIALLAGFFIATQGSINGLAGATTGVLPVVVIPVLVQLFLLGGYLLLQGEARSEIILASRDGRILLLLAISAVLGLGIMSTFTLSVMKLGPLIALAVIVFSQLFTSMVIEHFGWFGNPVTPISWERALAMLLFIVGAYLFNKG